MPGFELLFTATAAEQIERLSRDKGLAKRLKAVGKTLGLLGTNPRHPGLQSHRFQSLSGPAGEDVYEVYAKQATPAAYRVFWCYGPGRAQITIIAITSHP